MVAAGGGTKAHATGIGGAKVKVGPMISAWVDIPSVAGLVVKANPATKESSII
jgi:hypothetical protein